MSNHEQKILDGIGTMHKVLETFKEVREDADSDLVAKLKTMPDSPEKTRMVALRNKMLSIQHSKDKGEMLNVMNEIKNSLHL